MVWKEATAASVQVRVWDLVLPVEWLHEVGAVGKKAVVEVHEAYEPADLTLGLRLGEITNGLDLFGKGRDAMAVDMMTEEVQLRDAEEAFIGIDDDSVRGES